MLLTVNVESKTRSSEPLGEEAPGATATAGGQDPAPQPGFNVIVCP